MTAAKASTANLTTYLKAELAPIAIRTPGVLTIAGSDCSGGAGLEADIKTITLCKCFAMSCITAITAQNSKGLRAVYPTSAKAVKNVLEALKDDMLNLKAVKVGLLPETCFDPVAKFLRECSQIGLKTVVLDPVMVANSGDSFGTSLVPRLINAFKYCRLITPNFAEAEIILSYLDGRHDVKHIDVTTVESLCDAAETIGKKIHSSVLLKGGHIPFNADGSKIDKAHPRIVYNILYDKDEKATTIFKSHYIDSENTQGTGCTMSSFIASGLAAGLQLKESIRKSIEFLNEAIRHSIPKRNGPVNHLWRGENDVQLAEVIAESEVLKDFSPFSPKLNLMNNLINDKEANPVWISFTHSNFFQSINNGTMRDSALRHFLLQDYKYLKSFAGCHRRLRDLAETPDSIEVAENMTQAIETGLCGHVNLLKTKFGINNPEGIEPSPALTNYVNYMEKYKNGDSFLDLETALIPCQFGFNPAVARFYKPTAAYDFSTGGVITSEISDFEPCKSDYECWLQAATDVTEDSISKKLQSIYNMTFNEEVAKGRTSYEHLQKIFIEGCQQEYDFWDECFKS